MRGDGYHTNPVRSFVRSVQGRAVGFGLVVGTIVGIVWGSSVAWGFLSGMALSVVNFQLMAVDAFDMVDNKPRSSRKFIIIRFAIRYTVMFGFLALIATRTDFNIVSTFVGVFFVQVVLVVGQILDGLKHNRTP